MKPVGPKNDLAHVLDDKPLMMLNWGLLGIRYIRQLLAFTNTNITTTRGTALSTELWNMILGFALVDTQNSFCFVQGISLRKFSMGKILHCRRINLEGGPLCGNLDCAEAVGAFEEFMNKPNQHASLPFTPPTLQPGQGYGNTFDILITSADDNLPVDSACLFSNVMVPDVISRMEGGVCSFCFGSRLFCPGCTRGRAQAFEVFMGCGVDLACPLCIGIDFSLEHRAFLQTYYWDDPPEEKRKSIDDWLEQRMEELGYRYWRI
jgi:hypothetical protein